MLRAQKNRNHFDVERHKSVIKFTNYAYNNAKILIFLTSNSPTTRHR